MNATAQDLSEFAAYVRTLTDCQLFNVLRKEGDANRDNYVRVTLQEIKRRRANGFRRGT